MKRRKAAQGPSFLGGFRPLTADDCRTLLNRCEAQELAESPNDNQHLTAGQIPQQRLNLPADSDEWRRTGSLPTPRGDNGRVEVRDLIGGIQCGRASPPSKDTPQRDSTPGSAATQAEVTIQASESSWASHDPTQRNTMPRSTPDHLAESTGVERLYSPSNAPPHRVSTSEPTNEQVETVHRVAHQSQQTTGVPVARERRDVPRTIDVNALRRLDPSLVKLHQQSGNRKEGLAAKSQEERELDRVRIT